MNEKPRLWASAATRFAGLGKVRARIALGLVALLLAACLGALTVADSTPLGAVSDESGQADLLLYEKIVDGIRSGQNYYTVAADALRAGSYPLRPFFTFRMPALATLLAAVPLWGAAIALYALSASVALVWGTRLGNALARPAPRFAAMVLLFGSMLAFLQPGLIAFHEIWAGLLVALSLGLRNKGRWIEPVAIALMAMLVRETAALYVVIMALAAWIEGERREALGWGAALLLFGIAFGVHGWAVGGVTGPLDPASPGWTGLLGFGFFVKSLVLATSLQLLPLWIAASIVGLALLGWTAWRDPVALRMLATLTAYAVAISVFARPDTFYWGLMVAPIFLTGLVFVPDALRDLLRQALDRRRIKVTRVAR